MKHIIQFKIYKDENYYIGKCIDLPIVTQGKTLDEVVANIEEALRLHLKGDLSNARAERCAAWKHEATPIACPRASAPALG